MTIRIYAVRFGEPRGFCREESMEALTDSVLASMLVKVWKPAALPPQKLLDLPLPHVPT